MGAHTAQWKYTWKGPTRHNGSTREREGPHGKHMLDADLQGWNDTDDTAAAERCSPWVQLKKAELLLPGCGWHAAAPLLHHPLA